MERLKQLWAERWHRIILLMLGIEISSVSFAAFNQIKLHFPSIVPFYADPSLAAFDHWLFGRDAWIVFNAIFGWASPVILGAYSLWLLVQMLAYPVVLMCPPSDRKAQLLLTHAMMWALLGILCALAVSSVGPIFYDRLLGGDRFAGVGYPHDLFVADYLWKSYVTGEAGFGVGISAMPSLHVAAATWLALVIRTYLPRLAWIGWTYVALIYVGSVLTGWHYATDGIVGAGGTVACWLAVGLILDASKRRARLDSPQHSASV
jgi:hypothetical protein